MSPSIIIGSDHAGFELKEKIRIHLISEGYKVEDAGPTDYSSVNYVAYAKKSGGSGYRRPG